MSIEARIKMVSNRLTNVDRVIRPNNLNSTALSSINLELIQLEQEGADVLNLRCRYGLIQSKVRSYRSAQVSY